MDNTEYLDYINGILLRWEEIMWHELAGIAAPKADFVGIDFIRSKKIEGDTVEKVVDNCIREIIAAGLAKEITYVTGGLDIFLKLNIKGCIHLPVEAQLRKDGIQPYTCILSHMFFDRVVEGLGYEHALLAELNVDENKGQCVAKCALYETPEKIGQVSDWTKL